MKTKDTILVHAYASPYYDPVKAHEYYEEHKKLKGNQRKISTATLNEEGKKAALYVKKNLDEEKKAKADELTEATKKKYEEARNSTLSQVKANSSQLKINIENLKVRLKKMNPAQRKQAEIHIKAEIQKLKDANAEERKKLQEAYKETAKGISEEHSTAAKALNEEYHNKYADEVDKMNEDAAMKKVKSGGKSSGKDGKYVFVYRRGNNQNTGKKEEKYTFKANRTK